MNSEKIFNINPDEAKRRRSITIKESDSNLPITNEPALTVVLRGSNNLVENHSDFLLKIYRPKEIRG
jgi:hypothetical protein